MSSTAFTIAQHEEYATLNLPLRLDIPLARVFFQKAMELQGTNLLVICGNHTAFPKEWLRVLLRVHLNFRTAKKGFKLIGANPVLLNYLKVEGVHGILSVSKDVNSALEELGFAQKKTMDTEFVNPFLDATIYTLKVQAQIEAVPGQLFIKKAGMAMSGDVSGIIGIVADNFKGSVVISFPEKTFLSIMSQMLGEEINELSQEIIDGAGELTNIIFGQAKVTLNDKGHGIKTALPTVVSGKEHIFSSQTRGPIVVVPFETSVGKFFVEICLG